MTESRPSGMPECCCPPPPSPVNLLLLFLQVFARRWMMKER